MIEILRRRDIRIVRARIPHRTAKLGAHMCHHIVLATHTRRIQTRRLGAVARRAHDGPAEPGPRARRHVLHLGEVGDVGVDDVDGGRRETEDRVWVAVLIEDERSAREVLGGVAAAGGADGGGDTEVDGAGGGRAGADALLEFGLAFAALGVGLVLDGVGEG